MNRTKFRTLTMLLLTLACALQIVCSAWAAGPDYGRAAGSDDGTNTSPVITAGSGQAVEADETEEATEAETEADTKANAETQAAAASTVRQGASLGKFTTTGYCNCRKCSGGHNLTYSGTVPAAKHTISADLNVFPLGTKLMIDGVVYTVEDMGSGVNGNWLDIYYDSHSEAVAHGMKTQEVFAVIE